jgi:hypothetical protein
MSGDTASEFMLLSLLTLLANSLLAHAERHEVPNRDPRIAATSNGTAVLLREIDDPSSGTRWLLVRDKTNPGGPGRLELVMPGRDPGVLGRLAQTPLVAQIRPIPIIRPGNKLVVEEHSTTADAYLEGVALGPAGTGSVLNVRLAIGGRMVRAVAVAPGRAALEAAGELRR